MQNYRHASPEDSAWTLPSTPHLHRNLSFSPSNASTRAMRRHILQSQTSVAIDQPIEAEYEVFTPTESLRPMAPRECLYTSYLRRRLREIRPSSFDECTMQSNYSKGGSLAQRRRPFVARAVSVDNPYFDEAKGMILFP